MEDKKAKELINKILTNLDKNGIELPGLIEDLKELRTYALAAKIPLAVKVLRLTYEHLEENETFLIPIPEDEPVEEEEITEKEETEVQPVESLSYLISLYKDLKNKMNLMDLGDYRNALQDF